MLSAIPISPTPIVPTAIQQLPIEAETTAHIWALVA